MACHARREECNEDDQPAELRNNSGEVLRAVAAGESESMFITNHGRPAALLTRAGAVRSD